MSELDKELKRIVYGVAIHELREKASSAVSPKDAIEQIKQAFAEVGWSEPVVIHTPGVEPIPSEYMTGQEWFDRFEKQMKFFEDSSTITPSTALTAAKRASGLGQ